MIFFILCITLPWNKIWPNTPFPIFAQGRDFYVEYAQSYSTPNGRESGTGLLHRSFQNKENFWETQISHNRINNDNQWNLDFQGHLSLAPSQNFGVFAGIASLSPLGAPFHAGVKWEHILNAATWEHVFHIMDFRYKKGFLWQENFNFYWQNFRENYQLFTYWDKQYGLNISQVLGHSFYFWENTKTDFIFAFGREESIFFKDISLNLQWGIGENMYVFLSMTQRLNTLLQTLAGGLHYAFE